MLLDLIYIGEYTGRWRLGSRSRCSWRGCHAPWAQERRGNLCLCSRCPVNVLNCLQKEGFEAWASAARAHGNEFHQYGPRGPATWVYNEGKNIPQSAVSTGVEHDWTLYIARAWIDVSPNYYLMRYESI